MREWGGCESGEGMREKENGEGVRERVVRGERVGRVLENGEGVREKEWGGCEGGRVGVGRFGESGG